MKDTNICDNSATPPRISQDRHFYERQADGSFKPVTFRFISWGSNREYSAFEYEGRPYQPHMIAAMVRAGVLYPANRPSARLYGLKQPGHISRILHDAAGIAA